MNSFRWPVAEQTNDRHVNLTSSTEISTVCREIEVNSTVIETATSATNLLFLMKYEHCDITVDAFFTIMLEFGIRHSLL